MNDNPTDNNVTGAGTSQPPMAEIVSAKQPAPARQPSRFAAGFSAGCLVSCILLLLPFLFCIGSCAYILGSGGGMNDVAGTAPGTLLEAGSGDSYIAVIGVNGIITRSSDDSYLLPMPTSTDIARQIRDAADDALVCGIILDMDTPGGEVVASDEIRQAVDYARSCGTPVVTCMHSYGASGGYYIASGCDWIIANRHTVTGSVGVIIAGYQYSGLMDKIGISPLVYRSGDMKDMLSGTRTPTDKENAYVSAMIDASFMEFCKVISAGRPERFPTPEDVRSAEFADGRWVSGADAVKYGLIDQVGSFRDAVDKVRQLADAPDAPAYRCNPGTNWLDQLMSIAAGKNGVLRLEGMPRTRLKPGACYYVAPELLP